MYKPVAAISIALLIQACSMLGASAQSVGDRVLANPMSMPGDKNYFPGTVLKVNNDGSFVVRLDLREDHTDGEIYNVQKKWTKPGSGQRPANWAETSDSDKTFYGLASQAELEQKVGGQTVGGNGGGMANLPGAGSTVTPQPAPGPGPVDGKAASSLPGASGFFKAGDRVLADPTSMGTHYAATILKAIDGGRGGYVINLDKPFTQWSGTTFQIPTKNVKAGNVGVGPLHPEPLDKIRAIRYGVDPNMYGQAPANNTNYATNNANNNNNVAKDPGKPVQGKGKPPDGIYDCNKISGSSYIHIGTIEIKGNTYRAFAESGPFHPYTMDGAGGITWTGGFADMPDGWTIGKGNFNGLDHTGKPWIQIRYISNRNAHETVDAILR
ncbi:MAG: tudor domain-containing protein [Candidatus Melainabacteria bacterium]|nr:tudor domain-containing protein [Candidatus Melainabacteria bacterium]